MENTINRRRMLFLTASILCASGFGPDRGFASDLAAKPEKGTVKLGSTPWLGAGLWEVAAKNGLFKAESLDAVDIVYFTLDSDMNAALAAGQLHAGVLATHTALNFLKAGLPIKIVALLDMSTNADAILSDGSIESVKELRGVRVAYEEGSTSEILLSYALAQHGMTLADIEKVPMPAADAGVALVAGQVPVAVTYEPYLTVAARENSKVRTLFTAGQAPGLIADVLVVRDEVISETPGQIVALVKAWSAALDLYRKDTAASRYIIAEAEGVKASELASAFDGISYYSAADSKAQFAGPYLATTLPAVLKAAQQAGLVEGDLDLSKAIDARFADAAAS